MLVVCSYISAAFPHQKNDIYKGYLATEHVTNESKRCKRFLIIVLGRKKFICSSAEI